MFLFNNVKFKDIVSDIKEDINDIKDIGDNAIKIIKRKNKNYTDEILEYMKSYLSKNINRIDKNIAPLIYSLKNIKIYDKAINEINNNLYDKDFKGPYELGVYIFNQSIDFNTEISYDIEEIAPIINPNDIKPITNINKFIPRENQIDAFNRLEKNGLETGIHCQATGCGKSFIIIRYCDYAFRTIKIPKIIIFTERINILSDLFSFTKNKLTADKDKLNKWKELGIGDLTKFNIINRVTIKNKDWNKLLKEATKPTILVINRAFLTLGKKYKTFNSNDLDLVLHDECHNTSSVQCHELLLKVKSLNVPIVGFSATPLRTGKYDKSKLLEIYAKDNELNLLTNYNMIYAISKNLILPPEFYWYQIESYKKDNTNELVSQEELGAVLELLNHIINQLPNKKIIAWCGTILLAKKWLELFKVNYKQRIHLKHLTFGIDTSENTNSNDYEEFKISKGNCILFCANKHREGSDIYLLDASIFLDKVKDRGAIPFIQCIGRTLRICFDTPSKIKGIIMDGFVKGQSYEKQFVDKIIGYYMALENVASISNEETKTKYEQYIELKDIVKFDKENEIINMMIGTKIIKINCNKLDWEQIIGKFDSILQDKIKLSVGDNFKHKGEILKKEFGFNENTDFIKAYQEIDKESKIKYNLPEIDTDYSKLLNDKSWIELLELKPDFLSFNELVKFIKNTKKTFNKNNWKELNKMNKKIPIYPEYYYNNFTYKTFEKNI